MNEYLATPIASIFRLKTDIKIGLERMGIVTVRDLLYHFPTRYSDATDFVKISELADGADATISGTIKKIASKKTFTTKVPITEATLEDMSGTIKVIWFHQPYIAKMFSIGQSMELSGKVSIKNGVRSLLNPIIKKEQVLSIDNTDSLFSNTEHNTTLTPVYRETKGVSSLWFHHAITKILANTENFPEIIPEEYRKQYSLPAIKTALIWIHTPKDKDDALKARKRFSFEEIFTLNVVRQRERLFVKQTLAYNIEVHQKEIDYFTSKYGFEMTDAQKSSLDHILTDIQKDYPMSRLLEGDVGSGKTAVAAAAVYATVTNRPSTNGKKQTFGNLQVAYMAPTELLATQHFESFIEFFRGTGISIALITGSGCRKFPTKVASSQTPWTTISRAQLKKWITNGEIPIVIGTHTLIQKSLEFKHLALAIIDEQHRFGLNQRKGLAKKDKHFPHLLSMTATPIPRTLALTIYGDLDLSVIDTMPIGRKKIITELVFDKDREKTYEKIREILKEGRQVYIICPRIEDSDPDKATALIAKSVESEAKRIKKDIFPEYTVGTIHSKMSRDKKDDIMQDFARKEIDILVATSVIEVGINVPNATVIIIEGAERFGLSQLHQLRGRVMRSSYQPYCYLFANIKSEKTEERMKLFITAKNGFELAEYDLQLRGAGELVGAKQWGLSDLAMEALRNPKLVEAARQSAIATVATDPELNTHLELKKQILSLGEMHLE